MIYFKQDFDIHPASPATRDRFIELATTRMLPASERIGGRLVAAFFNHAEWFSQINHITAFDSLDAFVAARAKAGQDEAWRSIGAALDELAPERREELLEPLGPVPASRLQQGIDDAAREPAGAYTFAILEVSAGQMEPFAKMLGAAAGALPILASWRPIAGRPNQVIDLWSGEIGRQPYRPDDDQTAAFFGPLREVAPRERLVTFYPLPYSPLR